MNICPRCTKPPFWVWLIAVPFLLFTLIHEFFGKCEEFFGNIIGGIERWHSSKCKVCNGTRQVDK